MHQAGASWFLQFEVILNYVSVNVIFHLRYCERDLRFGRTPWISDMQDWQV